MKSLFKKGLKWSSIKKNERSQKKFYAKTNAQIATLASEDLFVGIKFDSDKNFNSLFMEVLTMDYTMEIKEKHNIRISAVAVSREHNVVLSGDSDGILLEHSLENGDLNKKYHKLGVGPINLIKCFFNIAFVAGSKKFVFINLENQKVVKMKEAEQSIDSGTFLACEFLLKMVNDKRKVSLVLSGKNNLCFMLDVSSVFKDSDMFKAEIKDLANYKMEWGKVYDEKLKPFTVHMDEDAKQNFEALRNLDLYSIAHQIMDITSNNIQQDKGERTLIISR